MIRRWDNPKEKMIAADEGNFVYYGDHIAELERLRAEDHDYAYIAASVRAACIAAVEALEPRLDMEKYKGGYDCCGCSTPTSLYVDVIDALREVQP